MGNMIRILLLFLVFNSASLIVAGQSKFIVKVSHDTISMDEALKVEFIIENLEGEFITPSFDGFTVASGPMTSSSFTMINGDVTQKKSVSYLLIPQDSGSLRVSPAKLVTGDKEYSTQSIDIFVLDRNSKYRRSTKGDKIIGKSISSPSTKRVLKRI